MARNALSVARLGLANIYVDPDANRNVVESLLASPCLWAASRRGGTRNRTAARSAVAARPYVAQTFQGSCRTSAPLAAGVALQGLRVHETPAKQSGVSCEISSS